MSWQEALQKLLSTRTCRKFTMNILFILKSLNIGGVEVVTLTLAKAFRKRGHNVGVFIFSLEDDTLRKRLPESVSLYEGYGYKESNDNVKFLRNILKDQNVNVVINQWGLPFLPIRVINSARKGLDVKVISVYHNQVDMNGRLMTCDKAIRACSNAFIKPILKVKRRLVKFVTSRSMRYVYNHSDLYEVLSPSFIEIFKDFTGIKNPTHLIEQTNPVTIETDDFVLDVSRKQKEIIYVGRLDLIQKRVNRVIETWNHLEKKFPEWRLTIVGDGEDRENLESQVKNLGLKRVSFEGFQNPLEYYKRASLLMLLSDFEGFPLILAECMSFGVVPCVYDSYSSVRDIIDDQRNGIIVPWKKNINYNAESSAHLIADLMNNEEKRKDMSLKAIEKSENFSLERICDEWERTFKSLHFTSD